MLQPEPIFTPRLSWEVAIDAFLWSRKVKSLSARTLDYYAFALKQFCQAHECQSPLNCQPSHITAYIAWLQERKVRSISILSCSRALNAFFNWLRQEGLCNDNPLDHTPIPKSSQPLPKTVTEAHFLAAISVLYPSKFADLRDLALFRLAFDTGARLGELLGLKVGGFGLGQ